MRRVRAGSPDAVQDLFVRYSDDVRRVVRSRLHRRLRSRYDSLDFVQSVWASFLQIPADRYTFDSPDDLVGFLARVAYNKVVEVFRQHFQAKRDVSREEGVAEADEVRDPRPTPSQVLIAEEHWERLLRNQPPHYRHILELLRQGYSHVEIADRLGLNPKLIQRLLHKLTQRVARP
jgi:RNA polymerase sigma-70 factor (ECF subfamily)